MIKEWIINWFSENGNVESEIDYDCNYIDMELIDSFAFINLISDCEEHFNIIFDDADFESNIIFSVNGLVKCIEEKQK